MLSMDWIMRKIESPGRRGIRWMLTTQLQDLDFVDDICLTSHRLSDMLSKTEEFSTTAQKTGLNASITKTKQMRMNSRTNEPIKLQGENIEEVEEFTYLGSKMTADGSSERGICTRLSKADQAFATLRNIWKSGKICQKMKIRLLKSNVLSILLYGSESWKMTHYQLQTWSLSEQMPSQNTQDILA